MNVNLLTGTKTLTTAEAAMLIENSDGKIFSVTFFKRGDKSGKEKNELRTMRCVLGSRVKKGLAGGPAAYNPADHGLIWTYLMSGDENREPEAKNRRSISVDGIVRLAIGGEDYAVEGLPFA
jgi:hypothetical protein